MITETPTRSMPDQPVEFPVFRTRKEMNEFLEGIGYREIDRLATVGRSVEDREILLKKLKEADPSLNGNADALIDHLNLNHQEIERKESWLKKLLKLPGKVLSYIWSTIKAHPFLTTAAVVGLLYYTGLGTSLVAQLQGGVSRLPDGALKKAATGILSVGGAAAETVGGASPGAGVPPGAPI